MKAKQVINLASYLLYATSGIMFVSSFFVEDSKKAVKRRWNSLYVFGGAYAAQIGGMYVKK